MRGKNRVCAPFRVRVIQRSGQADEDAARAVLPTEGGAQDLKGRVCNKVFQMSHYLIIILLPDKRRRKEFAVPLVLLDKSALLKKIVKAPQRRQKGFATQ